MNIRIHVLPVWAPNLINPAYFAVDPTKLALQILSGKKDYTGDIEFRVELSTADAKRLSQDLQSQLNQLTEL